MKNNGLFFTRNDCRQAAARENMKLKAEIHQTQHKMESLLNQFDQVTDPPLIDCGADAGERVDAAVLSNDGPRI